MATPSTRHDLLNLRPQLVIRQSPGMVHGDLPRAVEQHKRRRGRSAVHIEVVLADGDGHVEKAAVEAVAHGIDVGEFSAGRRIFDLRGIAVKPRGT